MSEIVDADVFSAMILLRNCSSITFIYDSNNVVQVDDI